MKVIKLGRSGGALSVVDEIEHDVVGLNFAGPGPIARSFHLQLSWREVRELRKALAEVVANRNARTIISEDELAAQGLTSERRQQLADEAEADYDVEGLTEVKR